MEMIKFSRFGLPSSPVLSSSTGGLSSVGTLAPFSSSPLLVLPSYQSSSKRNNERSHRRLYASSEGVPNELVEDSKFVPLNAEEPVFGPPALLLLGFEADETEKIQKFLKELDGNFLKVIHCTEEMIKNTLWNAIQTEQPNLSTVKIAESLPRICFFSGLSGEEMMMFIDAFPETGLKPAVFAAMVPNSADKLLQEVIEEIMGDHELLTGRNQTS
ncbi:hypothetical protein LUZ60_014548 [Juncus effusus]|nr:hypothetical protein LUZ60_014548 [Juncus effusus]